VSQCVRDNNQAAFECTSCRATLCPNCVRHSVGNQYTVMLCPRCGALVEPLQLGRRASAPSTFWQYLASAPIWPMSGRGLLVLHINAFMLFGMLLVRPLIALIFGWMGRVVGTVPLLLFAAFVWGYLALMLFETIQATGTGAACEVTTPTVTIQTVYRTFFRFIVVLALWTVPAIVVSNVLDGTPETWREAALMLLGSVVTLGTLIFGPDASLVVRIVAAASAFMFPISLLAVANFESLRGLNPVPLFSAIRRAPLEYACCCLGFYLVPVGLVLLLRYAVINTLEVYWRVQTITGYADLRPVVLFLLFVVCLVSVYGMYVAGRVLGGFCAGNREHLGWT
jgi:hypothetical protein